MNLGYALHGVVAVYLFLVVAGRLVVSIHQEGRGAVRGPPPELFPQAVRVIPPEARLPAG